MAAVQPLKISTMLLVQCENHFDILQSLFFQLKQQHVPGGPVAEEAASCCLWPMDVHTGIAVVRGWTVATSFGLALSLSIALGCAGRPAAFCSNGDSTCLNYITYAAQLTVSSSAYAASSLTLLNTRQRLVSCSKSMCIKFSLLSTTVFTPLCLDFTAASCART